MGQQSDRQTLLLVFIKYKICTAKRVKLKLV